MKATRPIILGMLAVVAALLACLLEWWDQTRGAQPWPLPATIPLALCAAAAAVLVLALPVRRWTHGDRSRPLDPLRAARTLALAKASAQAGALFTGWFLGVALAVVRDLAIEPRRARFVVATVSALVGLVLTGAGLLAERWCRRPPDDDDTEPNARAGRSNRGEAW